MKFVALVKAHLTALDLSSVNARDSYLVWGDLTYFKDFPHDVSKQSNSPVPVIFRKNLTNKGTFEVLQKYVNFSTKSREKDGVHTGFVALCNIETLAKQVGEQTAELQNLNNTKDRLFSIIGHDLRSPIASLKGIIELIDNQELSRQEFQDLLKHLQKSSKIKDTTRCYWLRMP